ncbi:phage major capsid protein [Piscirickettsia salmonis]|uniref:phage major capsid protein n=1 Tax=Piscirickettsia salmonis TaxID=1238 RepID=UPI00202A167D|nr:phage major capsid protein [Piscirickettsia salmonis]
MASILSSLTLKAVKVIYYVVTCEYLGFYGHPRRRECAALFGDFSNFIIADRGGISLRRLNELYAATGEVGYLMWLRVDALLLEKTPLSNLKPLPLNNNSQQQTIHSVLSPAWLAAFEVTLLLVNLLQLR